MSSVQRHKDQVLSGNIIGIDHCPGWSITEPDHVRNCDQWRDSNSNQPCFRFNTKRIFHNGGVKRVWLTDRNVTRTLECAKRVRFVSIFGNLFIVASRQKNNGFRNYVHIRDRWLRVLWAIRRRDTIAQISRWDTLSIAHQTTMLVVIVVSQGFQHLEDSYSYSSVSNEIMV